MNTTTFTHRPAALRAAILGCVAAAVLFIAGCFPSPPRDDEGHASFAREVIPVLLGRRALGVDEVEVVADVSQLLGRDVAIRMLMKDNAYVDHWADAIIDIIKMQRDPDGGLSAQDSACWGAPTRANPDPAIAEWGRMLVKAQDRLQSDPHLAILPGVCIAITALGFTLFGEALREALDPKSRR